MNFNKNISNPEKEYIFGFAIDPLDCEKFRFLVEILLFCRPFKHFHLNCQIMLEVNVLFIKKIFQMIKRHKLNIKNSFRNHLSSTDPSIELDDRCSLDIENGQLQQCCLHKICSKSC